MRRSILLMVMTLAMATTATPALAYIPDFNHVFYEHVENASSNRAHAGNHLLRDIVALRRATAPDHRLGSAIADGYEAFAIDPEVGGTPTTGLGLPGDPTCFDSDTGGMGVHYVDFDNLGNPSVHVTTPEAMVYEITRSGKLRLVAVEYIVPDTEVSTDDLPMLFGREFHHHPYLPVYILHAWVWKHNPNGMFADFNPRVRDCPV